MTLSRRAVQVDGLAWLTCPVRGFEGPHESHPARLHDYRQEYHHSRA
jgi:hypothetical protein